MESRNIPSYSYLDPLSWGRISSYLRRISLAPGGLNGAERPDGDPPTVGRTRDFGDCEVAILGGKTFDSTAAVERGLVPGAKTLAMSPVIECLFDRFDNRRLSARLAKAPCEVCGVDDAGGTERGEDCPRPIDVVRRLPSRTFERPSLGEPSGLGVTKPGITSSPFVPDNEVALGLLKAVVADAFTCADPLVNACLAENMLDAEPGLEEDDDRRDVGFS